MASVVAAVVSVAAAVASVVAAVVASVVAAPPVPPVPDAGQAASIKANTANTLTKIEKRFIVKSPFNVLWVVVEGNFLVCNIDFRYIGKTLLKMVRQMDIYVNRGWAITG